MKNYKPLISHLVFCFVIWVVYSKLPALEVTSISKVSYLSLIGLIKYLPVFVFSSYLSHKISTKLTKAKAIQLLLLTYFIFIGIHYLLPSDLTALGSLLLVSLLAIVYEPLFDTVKATVVNKTKDYFFINAMGSLVRTSMRFIAPLIILIPLLESDIERNLSLIVFLLVGFFILTLIYTLPRFELLMERDNISYTESLKSIFLNPLCRYLIVIYSIFYLSINYLEYFALLLPLGRSGDVGYYYSSLGLGFMTSNILIIVLKRLIKNEKEILKFTLMLTGICLVLLAVVPLSLHLYLVFLMGIGNGFSVPVATAIMQKNLKLKDLSMFSGVIDTTTNFCALISVGIGWVILKAFSYKVIFITDGVIILLGALYWHIVVPKDLK